METEETAIAPPRGAGGKADGGRAGVWKVTSWVALVATMEASLPVESHFMHGAGFWPRTICGVLVFAGCVLWGLAMRVFWK